MFFFVLVWPVNGKLGKMLMDLDFFGAQIEFQFHVFSVRNERISCMQYYVVSLLTL
jgi:hypothetical protein